MNEQLIAQFFVNDYSIPVIIEPIDLTDIADYRYNENPYTRTIGLHLIHMNEFFRITYYYP